MKRLPSFLTLCAALALLTGCATETARLQGIAASNAAYAAQARTFEPIEAEFLDGLGQGGGTVTFTGLKRFVVRAQLEALPPPPEPKSLVQQVGAEARGIAPYAIGAYLGSKMLDAKGDTVNTSSTVNNNAAPAAEVPVTP